MDQEQVFEDLTIRCTPFQNTQSTSSGTHKTDQSNGEAPLEGAPSSAESSKKAAEKIDNTDFIDQDFGESEVSQQ